MAAPSLFHIRPLVARILFPAIAAIIMATALPACSGERGEAAMRPRSEELVIPELKSRPEGLADREFDAVKKRYAELRSAITTTPSAVEPLVTLAQLFMNEARITGEHPYYYPAAERMLDEALRRDGNHLPALISKGSVLLSLHHFDEALRIAEQARALSPETAIIYGIICDASVELGRYEEAVAAADRMVAMRPDLRSYSRVSYLREIHGDIDGAIEAMTMAVKAGAPGYEDTEWARQALGTLYLVKGDVAAAERTYLTSLTHRPCYPFAIAGIARVRTAQGRHAEALRLLDSAVALIPEFSFIEMQADIYRATGDDRRADSLVALVETMLGEDEAAGHLADKEFALLYANHTLKPQEAYERARKELARRPENIEAQHAMALALLRIGKGAEAKLYIDRALRMGTKDRTMLAHAALIEAAAGNRAESHRHMKQAMSARAAISLLLLRELRGVM